MSYGYTDAELDAMTVWQVATRLGLAPGARGVMKGSRHVQLPSDGEESPAGKKGKGQSFGRFDPRRLIPRTHDAGKVYRGEEAR